MKKVLGFLLAVCLGMAIDRLGSGGPAVSATGGGHGGGVEACPSTNGDVNADGKIDLTDAVTILGHLFRGSPTELLELCAEPPPPPAPSSLPDTGETKCYELNGVEIPCADATCKGQDGAYATGCPGEGRFTDNGDGTVTDHCTGLQWQQNSADVNGDRQSTDQDFVPWCDALKYCESLSFAGHDDWRLPNVRELQSIVDYGRSKPSIDPIFGALSSYYWSSTLFAGGRINAWNILFNGGSVGLEASRGGVGYVRAVRSEPSSP